MAMARRKYEALKKARQLEKEEREIESIKQLKSDDVEFRKEVKELQKMLITRKKSGKKSIGAKKK